MFHVKHYSLISNFYNKNNSNLTHVALESIIDLIYSNKNKKIIFYEDSLYTQIIDAVQLSWESASILILGPKDNYSMMAPHGFNQNNIHSINYFTRIYSAFKDDIKGVICANSQKNIIINRDQYNVFEINQSTEYDELHDFCKKKYERVEIVNNPGEYAIRGGIIDLYPSAHTVPKRISFLNELTEIKSFEIDSQRTLNVLLKTKIETLQKKKRLKEVLMDECSNWEAYKLNQNGIVINDDINTKNEVFPFKKILYPDFKKIKDEYQILYNDVNRLNGFVYKKQIVAPEWFQNPSADVSKNAILDIASINIGDFVVHRDHGIGKFLDFKIVDNPAQEFMIIQYADYGTLTVDVAHLNKITFYASKSDDVQLDSLNKPGAWKRKKNNAKKNVQNIVNNLVNAYVNRENAHRNTIDPIMEEQGFVDEFKYIDTNDQIRCWDDIKNDLQSNIPMDRLICGDVGFGKTEMAIRTAYRYATNSKKVVVLAPTTILTEQLYKSFNERMSNYGILIDRISRLRKKTEINRIHDLWINNQLDIIIGTHAILYNEIYLNNCDLLIIDEEHRFGVRQKEKIKELNPSIDMLTMSATPIPRTLNMALSGLKQISTLSSPPKNRKPIITHINYYNEELIINTINNEIFRKGQIYFVHNNVKTIDSIVKFLQNKMPYLKVNYIHGQMDPNIIDRRMNQFTNKTIDLLVCTSIIENGIDIPNVNTVIINNAHEFGLSQLYQIRGRVGRSNKQAYALLMIPQKLRLNSSANLRLKAIEKYTSLGSGYKISNMDLTIRGGGSMFGYDQSGNIENIGYELVAKLMNEYIDKNYKNQTIIYPKINLINKGIIPTQYIFSTKIRLLFYRKIKATINFQELNDIIAELIDRFGAIPKELMQIIEIQKIYIDAKKLYIPIIEEKDSRIVIYFHKIYWEQKLNNLLNKINEFINERGINYEVKELNESLIFKFYYNDNTNIIMLIKQIINDIKD